MASISDIKQRIKRLDEGTLTALVQQLLAAELHAAGIAPDTLQLSDNLPASDGGLDARLDGLTAVNGHPLALPEGDVGIQIKAVKSTAPSRFKMKKEMASSGVRALFQRDGTYILVSSQDFNAKQLEALKDEIRTEALTRTGSIPRSPTES